jgi:hypothetical protein
MAPILGIYASQISGHLFAPSGAWDSIATGVGTGSSGTITFSSIPSTYTHLQIRAIARDDRGVALNNCYMRLNSATTGYTTHYLIGNGTTASTDVWIGSDYIDVGINTGASATSGIMSAFVIDILDYANTNKNKTVRSLSGSDQNGSGSIRFQSGLWQSTNAITSITLHANTSWNFTSTTQFALYGIKGN